MWRTTAIQIAAATDLLIVGKILSETAMIWISFKTGIPLKFATDHRPALREILRLSFQIEISASPFNQLRIKHEVKQSVDKHSIKKSLVFFKWN